MVDSYYMSTALYEVSWIGRVFGYESCRGVPDASLAVPVHFGLEEGEKSAYYFYDCLNSETPVSRIKILHDQP